MFKFTLDQVQCFKAVVESGSFNKAGEKLNRAKSAIRYAINGLEEQLGFALLDRRAYRPVATPQGESFLRHAVGLLKEYDDLCGHCERIAARVESRLVLSASGLCDLGRLYDVVKQAMQRYPATEIVLEREILSGERMLLRSQVDLAVCEMITNNRNLQRKRLGHHDLKMVIAGDHPYLKLARRDQTLKRLAQFPQVVQRSTLPDDDLQFGLHADALKWMVTDTPSKREVIMTGLGYGRLPDHLIEADLKSGGLVHLDWLDQDDHIDVYLARRRGGYVGQVAQFIWSAL